MATAEDRQNSELVGRLENIAKEVGEVKVLVAGMMPRPEIDGELSRRVSLDAYVSDQGQIKDRLAKLEASPMRLLAWVSGGAGCLGVVTAGASLIFSVVVWIVTHK